MSKTSNETLRAVALSVRPYITPFIEAKGHITNEELAGLIRRHAPNKVGSERSLGLVQEYLCDY